MSMDTRIAIGSAIVTYWLLLKSFPRPRLGISAAGLVLERVKV